MSNIDDTKPQHEVEVSTENKRAVEHLESGSAPQGSSNVTLRDFWEHKRVLLFCT